MQRDLIHHQSIDRGVAPMPAPPTNYNGHAHTFNISGGSFTNYEGNYNHSVTVNHYGTGILALSHHIAENALHNASERYPAPNCHPGTRKEALEAIEQWIGGTDTETGLLWLSGKVGVGKSAVMQEITNKLLGVDPGRCPIAASFFFGRGKGKRALGWYLFPTIAYQLAQNISELHEPINHIMQADPALPTRSIETQFQSLIVNPFLQCQAQGVFITPRVIMVDGLDECEDTDNEIQQLIIHCIATVQHIHHLPLRFIIASRPEHQICGALGTPPTSLGLHRVRLDSFESSKDIEKFLRKKFSDIYQEKSHLMPHVSSSWPGDFVIFQIIENAMGQWIYVTTVIKFTNTNFTSPDKQLKIVMDRKCQSLVLSPLDSLYTQILSHHPDLEVLLTVLGYFIVTSNQKPHNMSVSLGLDAGDIEITFQVIQSLLADDGSLGFAHASFRDYLVDPDRSGKYHIHDCIYRAKFATLAFATLSTIIREKFQLCEQEGQIIANDDITIIHLHNIDYPKSNGRDYILSEVQFNELATISSDFETTIASVDLSSIPLALDDLTKELLCPLYAVYNFFQQCRLEFSDIASPYQDLLNNCLDILSCLPGSLCELVHFAPNIISMSKSFCWMSITTLSQLLKVETQSLERLLKSNYIFFIIEDVDNFPEDFCGMERSVRCYSALVILEKCCLSSVRLSFLDQICFSTLQSQCEYLQRLSQIRYDRADNNPQWGLTFVLLTINPLDEHERMEECSAWPSHSHHFYEKIQVYTHNFLPKLHNAPVPVIRCTLNVLAFIIRMHYFAEDIQMLESTALITIQDQIFSQIFQLTGYQGRNMIIFRQPFLAYHMLMVTHKDPYHIFHYSGEFTALPAPPEPVDCNHPPQLSLHLFANDTTGYYTECFLRRFIHYTSNPLRSGAMFIGSLDNIIQQIKQIKFPNSESEPDLYDIMVVNRDRILMHLEGCF